MEYNTYFCEVKFIFVNKLSIPQVNFQHHKNFYVKFNTCHACLNLSTLIFVSIQQGKYANR